MPGKKAGAVEQETIGSTKLAVALEEEAGSIAQFAGGLGDSVGTAGGLAEKLSKLVVRQ